MENYFRNQDQEQERRTEHVRAEWTWQNNDFNNTMNDMHDLFHGDNMWKIHVASFKFLEVFYIL